MAKNRGETVVGRPMPENLKPFKKGESGNPDGRPSIRKDLQGQGLNRSETYNAIGMMLKLEKPELTRISKSETEQVWKVCIARAILRDIAQGYYSTVDNLFNRLFGKAKENIEANVTTQSKLPDGLTKEELLRLAGVE